MRLVWFKRPRGECRELIYRNQHFWRFGVAVFHKRSNGIVRKGVPSAHLGNFWNRCERCGFCSEVAIRLFKPTNKTRTKYTDWKKCEVGFCHRMTVLINGHQYWAKHIPEKRKVAIFNSHLGRTPIGYLPETMVPLVLRKEMRGSSVL